MLKVIDTLISVFNEMSELEKKNLAWLIRMEIDHVGKLTSKLRISNNALRKFYLPCCQDIKVTNLS